MTYNFGHESLCTEAYGGAESLLQKVCGYIILEE